MHYCFEFLAEDQAAIEQGGVAHNRWPWQAKAAHLRRDIQKQEDLTGKRQSFLKSHGFEDRGRGQGPAKILMCAKTDAEKADLLRLPDIEVFPEGSAVFTLTFELLTPLLTRDDDPFYLFDNPVRKDHTFGLPFLSAASLKGLAADAFQRGFPLEEEWKKLGQDDAERTMHYRQKEHMAKRLFGLADDADQSASAAGRLHFLPTWFESVQYLVMNPMKDDGSGVGTQPIQFEAIAPKDANGKQSRAEIQGFYFNPLGTKDADLATARMDIACLIGALAAWWPALGLGAKRLAGYGAIKPTKAKCQRKGFKDKEFPGDQSWKELAQHIAKGGQ